MKQKIIITAIIKNREKVALFERVDGSFELPQSSLQFGEQPEQCLSRLLLELFEVGPAEVRLVDTVSHTKKISKKDKANFFVVYEVVFSGLDKINQLNVSSKYQSILFSNISIAMQSGSPQITDETDFILRVLEECCPDVASVNAEDFGSSLGSAAIGETTDQGQRYTLYTDGGSRGNPGRSAAAYVIMDNSEIIATGGEFLGITNNAQAEYHSLRLGLEAALELGIGALSVKMDSLMVVSQIKGLYKIKTRDLWPVYAKIKQLARKFDKIDISHVRRESNKAADQKVNQILDENSNSSQSVI